jgi:hypothetical protein
VHPSILQVIDVLRVGTAVGGRFQAGKVRCVR